MRNEELKKILLYTPVLLFLFAGCSSLVQKSADVLEGNAFKEKTSALYRSEKTNNAVIELEEITFKDGEEALQITSSAWPSLALRGSYTGNGDIEFLEARILSSHVNGWNELNIQLLGVGHFSANDSSRTLRSPSLLRIPGKIERVEITDEKIRLKSSRLTGSAAGTALKNRRERILALTEWMDEYLQKNYSPVFANQRQFENYFKPLLFPELHSKKKQSEKYKTLFPKESSEWTMGDGVKWNRSYTEYLFPQELWELRNSGSLLRDWEEALPWMFIEYSWDSIIKSLDDATLFKIK